MLPCAKTDPTAFGKTRFWECVCCPGSVAPCPSCLAVEHLEFLRVTFGDRADLPLFPTIGGEVVAKAQVVLTIEAVAVL